MVYLPNIEFFSRITHLHLSAARVASQTIPLSVGSLPNVTHLSLDWSSTRSCTVRLKTFLARETTKVLVLWIDIFQLPEKVVEDLRHRDLVSQQLVLLDKGLILEYMDHGGFWTHAERVVQWRVKDKSERTHPSISPCC
ncbi:hypothetical protein L210DRAFT_873253 [Boletus edulis BED1]|uniref:Uncharacterized protein n=1 Tax=Boletus edulis BED1 TaxID=1328754 RepID=A0AAD4C369_BOLED|nr:hypothetical protein L210DRAFT_873253 [Boletus edulis BED1]